MKIELEITRAHAEVFFSALKDYAQEEASDVLCDEDIDYTDDQWKAVCKAIDEQLLEQQNEILKDIIVLFNQNFDFTNYVMEFCEFPYDFKLPNNFVANAIKRSNLTDLPNMEQQEIKRIAHLAASYGFDLVKREED